MKVFDVRTVVFWGIAAEGFGSPLEQLRFPLNEGVGMNVEALRQLGDGLIAFDGRDRHLRLEGRCVVATETLHDELGPLAGFFDPQKASHHISACSTNRGHPLALAPAL
jgi:hypothetical protein